MSNRKTAKLVTEARPVAAIVGLDPAYSGPTGLSVLVRTKDGGVKLHAHGSFPALELGIQRWLPDVVAQVCRPGERVVLVSECDAFGGHAVARKLGIGIGVVQGLLTDLNAIDPDSRVDVSQGTWRKLMPGFKHGMGRAAAKACAIKWVESTYKVTMPADEAEAVVIASWYSKKNPKWGLHTRPIPPTPTGLKKLVLE